MPHLGRVDQALAWARTTLAGACDSEPLDAPLLLAHVLGLSRAALIAHPEHPLTPAQAAAFEALIRRRAVGEPVAYLVGMHPFFDRDLLVTPDVLIPRPETEHLVELALAWAGGRACLRVVDVGTGSGAIALTLAAHLPQARVVAVDVSGAALAVAAKNVSRYGMDSRVRLVQGDLLTSFGGALARFDVIAANLPYVPRAVLSDLAVTRYEPRLALDGGADGLDVIRRLLAQAPDRLAAPGLLLLEIEAGQGKAVRELVWRAFPGARVDVLADYAGRDRIVRMERTGSDGAYSSD